MPSSSSPLSIMKSAHRVTLYGKKLLARRVYRDLLCTAGTICGSPGSVLRGVTRIKIVNASFAHTGAPDGTRPKRMCRTPAPVTKELVAIAARVSSQTVPSGVNSGQRRTAGQERKGSSRHIMNMWRIYSGALVTFNFR